MIAPYTAADAKGLLKAAIRDPNPVIFLENEILYGQSFPVPKLDDFVLPIGKARIARAGNDVTIVSFSMGMSYALKAAEELAKDGIDAEVIDLRTLRPMDTDTIIASVKKTGRIVTVEEGWPQAGIGAEIAARVMEQRLRLSRRAGHARVRQGRADALRRQSGKARAAVGRRSGRGGESGLLPVRRVMANGDRRSADLSGAGAAASRRWRRAALEILRAGIIDDELYVTALPAFDDTRTVGRGAGRCRAPARRDLCGAEAGPEQEGRDRPDRRGLRRRYGRAAR